MLKVKNIITLKVMLKYWKFENTKMLKVMNVESQKY